jgi:DNA-binding NtrC family response regulator
MVLVVDGERNVCKTLCWVLQETGYDTVIIEAVLPDKDGIETAVQIQRCQPECQILLTTGDLDGATRIVNARKKGIKFEVAVKPVEVPKLLRTLSHLTTKAKAA